MEDAATTRQRNKKGSACTYCRQLKFKCDAATHFPDPCSRCTKSGRRCTVDPHFKRIANKQRLDFLEKEVQRMRKELRSRPTTSTRSLPGTAIETPGNGIVAASPAADAPDIDPSISRQIGSEDLDGLELPPNVILALIREYYAHFHPLFPILPDQASFLSKYNSNKLLLWTVLAIASKESGLHAHLYPLLVNPVRQLAGDLYSAHSRSFETVEALLLLCVWPFPFQQTINDPSPMYAALATQIACQLGLHRPAFPADFAERRIPQSDPGELARKRVWFGCFVVGYSVNLKLGTPHAIRSGYTILSEIAKGRSSVIPEPLISELCLTYIGSKALSALGDSEYSPSGALPDCLPTVQAFESELFQIHERSENKWPPYMNLFYQALRLQLYSFALDSHNISSHVSRADTAIVEIYGKAVDACLRIGSFVSSNPQNSKYWPASIKYALFCSAVYTVVLANLEDHGSYQRTELLQCLRDSIHLMKSWSMFDKDHWSRISSHYAYLLRKLEEADQGQVSSSIVIAGLSTAKGREKGRRKNITVSLTSRVAANVLYDVVWTGKHGAIGEERERAQPRTDPHIISDESNLALSQPVTQNIAGRSLDTGELHPSLDDFGFAESWDYSGFFDISADWQSLIGNT